MKVVETIKNVFNRVFYSVKNIFVETREIEQQNFQPKVKTRQVKKIRQKIFYDNWSKYYSNPNFYSTSINGYQLNSYAMYKKIIDEDGTIRSALRERKLKITSLNWEVFCNKPDELSQYEMEIKEKIYEWLNNIEIESKLYTMLESLEYGQSIFEIIYKYVDGMYEVVDLQKRNISYFDYLKENQHLVYLSNGYLGGEPVDLTKDYPYQFIVHRNNADALNPHGESEIGLYGFVLYNMKKQFLIYYGVTGEKHGDPSLLASIDPYDKDGRPDANLESKLHDIAEEALINLDGINSRAISDERVRIEHLQQEIKNSFDYASAIELIKRLEEIHIKGSTLTSDTGEYGNYSTSQTHERTLDAIIKSDIKELNNTINRMVHMWVDLNFDTSQIEYYPEFRIIEPEILDSERVNLVLEFIDRGLEVKKKAIADEFNIPISDDLDENDCFNQQSDIEIVDENIENSSNDEEMIEQLKHLIKKNGKSKVIL
jgi:phage gp29-like protein